MDFEGHVTAYLYDNTPAGGGRLVQKQSFADLAAYTSHTPARTLTYAYDVFGRQLSVNDSAFATPTTYQYDDQGRTTQVASPQGVINYEYDPITGQLTRTWTGTSSASPVTDTTYAYDALGRLSTVTAVRIGGATVSESPTTYYYDLVGNLDATTAANGMTSDYQYDDLNRLTALYQFTDADGDHRYDVGETFLASFVYTLDDLGNRTAASEVVDGLTYAYTWTYDGLNRLVQEQLDAGDNALDYTAVYTYDLASNRLTLTQDAGSNGTVDETTTYTYDANDRLLTEVRDTGVYDNDRYIVYSYGSYGGGNRTQQTAQDVYQGTCENDLVSTTAYEYDLQGRMISVVATTTGVGGGPVGTTTTTYAYDDRGLRVSETTPGSGGVTTTYLFDVQNPTGYAQVLEEYVNNVLQRSYTLGLDVLAQTRHDAAARDFLLYDGHGNTRALLTAALAFSQKFAYDAYGVMLSSAQLASAATALTRLLYSGEWTRRDGTQYLRARDYNPATGRFTSLDPFAGNPSDPQSLHKYLYANGNPISRLDPSGMSSYSEIAVVSGISSVLLGILAPPALGAYNHYYRHGSFTPTAAIWGITATITSNMLYRSGDIGGLDISAFSTLILPQLGSIGYLSGETNDTIVVDDGFWLAMSVMLGGSLFTLASTGSGITIGAEVVFNRITSETSLFGYVGPAVAGPQTTGVSANVSIYTGLIWNLNKNSDYEGPFINLSIGLPFAGPATINTSFFSDPEFKVFGVTQGIGLGTPGGPPLGLSLVSYTKPFPLSKNPLNVIAGFSCAMFPWGLAMAALS